MSVAEAVVMNSRKRNQPRFEVSADGRYIRFPDQRLVSAEPQIPILAQRSVTEGTLSAPHGPDGFAPVARVLTAVGFTREDLDVVVKLSLLEAPVSLWLHCP